VTRRRTGTPARLAHSVRARRDGVARIIRGALWGTALSGAVAAVLWSRAQVQVSIRVIDACTVGVSQGVGMTNTCNARAGGGSPSAIPDAGNSKDGQRPRRNATPRQETSDDGFTTFIF
jgi:hypothetical protein